MHVKIASRIVFSGNISPTTENLKIKFYTPLVCSCCIGKSAVRDYNCSGRCVSIAYAWFSRDLIDDVLSSVSV